MAWNKTRTFFKCWRRRGRGHTFEEGAQGGEENLMSKLIGVLALAVLMTGGSSRVEAAAWCAFYDMSTYNCGFHTYQQCLDTISGVGGWCQRNFFEENRRPQDRRQRSPR
jgi:hypothetical protein